MYVNIEKAGNGFFILKLGHLTSPTVHKTLDKAIKKLEKEIRETFEMI